MSLPGLQLHTTYLLVISASLLISVLPAQLPLNGPLPTHISPIVVSGGEGSQSCPASDSIESARRNLSESIRSSLQTLLPGEVVPDCGSGKWVEVVHFDMSNTSQQCPSSWTMASSPARSCFASTPTTCPGTVFSTPGWTYNQICGRAIGYSIGSADAFADFYNLRSRINGPYVDGVSVTRGSPRQHVWSFAAGHSFRCPCDNQDRSFAPLPASFVGNNYFCDGNYNGALWDAMNCTTNCCTFNNPPWFSVSLPAPTSDDIEVRICGDEDAADENVLLSFLQLYVQ